MGWGEWGAEAGKGGEAVHLHCDTQWEMREEVRRVHFLVKVEPGVPCAAAPEEYAVCEFVYVQWVCVCVCVVFPSQKSLLSFRAAINNYFCNQCIWINRLITSSIKGHKKLEDGGYVCLKFPNNQHNCWLIFCLFHSVNSSLQLQFLRAPFLSKIHDSCLQLWAGIWWI